MAEYTYIGGSFSKLADVLSASGYFDEVETGTFTCNGNNCTGLICSIRDVQFFNFGSRNVTVSGSTKTAYSYLIQTSISTADLDAGGYATYTYDNFRPTGVYKTNDALMIVCPYGRILITKSNKGDTMVCCGNNYTSATSSQTLIFTMRTVYCVAVTDNAPIFTTYIGATTGYGTLLVPTLLTCNNTDQPTYADKVLWVHQAQNRSIGYFQYGGKRYFTDGFFAAEDPE